jgi:hypothetical protein
MKQLIRISFLFIMLFLTIPVFADGDMGAGGNSGTTVSGKVAEPTEITKTLDSGNLQQDASGIFSWVFQQISELIN